MVFNKILVANRGEIACRIFSTAKRLGIATVAVFSDADRHARHVGMADESVNIGGQSSAESYLVIEKILIACRQTGAVAVHPGYGFLSENAEFRAALDTAGLVFIGPALHAIKSMGDKITSKLIAEKAGVNTIPGYTDVVVDADHAVAVSAEIGYPVMIKASAGGGGKGMRVAWDEAACREGFQRATNEARASFGDDRVFIEKFIQEPRHIEIQVMADTHGNVLYLGERECSIQRRHQKVIEEAPSPFLDEATRRAMGEQSCALARAVGYQSAGTVEFIADAERNFYFLEMNTRLQVEHPVTECVTGFDLVEWMIIIASGGCLPVNQDAVVLKGWALEARVYAEDPLRNFMPSTGRLVGYCEPEGEGVRVDSGVIEGGEVSIYYDPMIAKVITYGADRGEAVERMSTALDGYYIRGVNHNISFLSALMGHPRFIAGRLTTNFIADEYADGFNAAHVSTEDSLVMVAVVAALHHRKMARAALLSGQLEGREYSPPSDWMVLLGAQSFSVQMHSDTSGVRVLLANDEWLVETKWRLGEPLVKAKVNGRDVILQVESNEITFCLRYRGTELEARVLSPRAAELSVHLLHKEPVDMSKFLISPMPGLLVSLSVEAGASVKKGQELAVVEAMKMENSLYAADDGTILMLSATVGDTLAVDQVILEFE